MSIVLIESDWNLKLSKIFRFKTHIGINESDWNLKPFSPPANQSLMDVLIESDWNLKVTH